MSTRVDSIMAELIIETIDIALWRHKYDLDEVWVRAADSLEMQHSYKCRAAVPLAIRIRDLAYIARLYPFVGVIHGYPVAKAEWADRKDSPLWTCSFASQYVFGGAWVVGRIFPSNEEFVEPIRRLMLMTPDEIEMHKQQFHLGELTCLAL